MSTKQQISTKREKSKELSEGEVN